VLGEGEREGERGKLNPHERVPSMREWLLEVWWEGEVDCWLAGWSEG